jgi:predicted RND superfamily exporter protein
MHRAVVTVFVKNADFLKTAEIIRRVQEFGAELIAGSGGTVEFGGDLAISQTMISSVVSTQLWSLIFTVIGIVLTIAVLTGSILTAFVALMPSCLALLGLFGFMGYSGISLGIATSMICAMTLGIGCDYSVYYLDRTRCGSDQSGIGCKWVVGSGLNSALRAARETAPAIVTIAITVALCFGILVFSTNPVNVRLGLFVAFTLLASAAFTFVRRGRLCREA